MYINITEFDELLQAMKNFPGEVESIINEVLHEEASPLIQDEVKRLIPQSNREAWKGKPAPAAKGKSLTDEKGNLHIWVKSSKKYRYLYFPDDGSNTRRHAGNQQFFMRGAESQREEIVERCVNRLTNGFENLTK